MANTILNKVTNVLDTISMCVELSREVSAYVGRPEQLRTKVIDMMSQYEQTKKEQ